MIFPKDREPYTGEDLFPELTVRFVTHDGELIPAQQGVIETRSPSDSFWDVIVGAGEVWRELGDDGWNRASFPLNLTDRYMGQVRNCVATFAYNAEDMSNVYVQCSQETADIEALQLGNIRAMAPAAYGPEVFPDTDRFLDEFAQTKTGSSHKCMHGLGAVGEGR